MSRIVITGINGFVGHHLAKELCDSGHDVIGIGRDETAGEKIKNSISEYYAADLTAEWPAITDVDGIIHLAGLAAVGPSFDSPQQYINANSAMVTNLCEYYMT